MDLQMNTFNIKKRLPPTLALACLALLASQNAQAAATFSSYATVTYTINNITNLTHAGDFSGLVYDANNPNSGGIAGSFELAPGQDISFITGDGSVTPSLVGAGTTFLNPAIESSYSRTFQLNSAANNDGFVTANYLAWFGLAFENASTTDSYDVGLTMAYELAANAGGDNAFSEVSLNYYNEDGTFSNLDAPGYIQAATGIPGTSNLQNSHAFNFTLAPKGFETLYVDAGITGTLEASPSPSPVPVPSALWLFSSALLAIPGIKNSKKAA